MKCTTRVIVVLLAGMTLFGYIYTIIGAQASSDPYRDRSAHCTAVRATYSSESSCRSSCSSCSCTSCFEEYSSALLTVGLVLLGGGWFLSFVYLMRKYNGCPSCCSWMWIIFCFPIGPLCFCCMDDRRKRKIFYYQQPAPVYIPMQPRPPMAQAVRVAPRSPQPVVVSPIHHGQQQAVMSVTYQNFHVQRQQYQQMQQQAQANAANAANAEFQAKLAETQRQMELLEAKLSQAYQDGFEEQERLRAELEDTTNNDKRAEMEARIAAIEKQQLRLREEGLAPEKPAVWKVLIEEVLYIYDFATDLLLAMEFGVLDLRTEQTLLPLLSAGVLFVVHILPVLLGPIFYCCTRKSVHLRNTVLSIPVFRLLVTASMPVPSDINFRLFNLIMEDVPSAAASGLLVMGVIGDGKYDTVGLLSLSASVLYILYFLVTYNKELEHADINMFLSRTAADLASKDNLPTIMSNSQVAKAESRAHIRNQSRAESALKSQADSSSRRDIAVTDSPGSPSPHEMV